MNPLMVIVLCSRNTSWRVSILMLKIHVRNVLLSALRCEWYSRMRFIFLKYPALHGILGIYFLQRNEKVRIFIVCCRQSLVQKETWRQKYAEIVSQFCICTNTRGSFLGPFLNWILATRLIALIHFD